LDNKRKTYYKHIRVIAWSCFI